MGCCGLARGHSTLFELEGNSTKRGIQCMLYDVIMSICMNISLLIVLALLLTKLEFVQELLLDEGAETEGARELTVRRRNQMILGGIFGLFCIISDYIGIQVEGAIPNARVIGVLSSGFLGGPVSGMTTAVIASVHRYMIFPERISTVACVLSAMLHGILGSLIGYRHRRDKQYSNWFLLLITFLAEAVHMILILLLTRPFSDALEIVKIVLVPMVIINSFGMVIFFNVFKSIFNKEDLKVAANVSLALRAAERCIPYLKDAETNPESMERIIEIIMEEYRCAGVAVIRGLEFLGRSSAFDQIELTKMSYPRLLLAAHTYRTTRISKIPVPEDAFYPLYEKHVILAAPIVRDEDHVLCLVMLIRKKAYSYRAEIEFVTGFANFFATQLKLVDMEKQKEDLRRAEIKALQSQINPHFLFNALNTISCFCREKPEKARELLMALSSYFRNMLSEIDSMVPLETELEHVRAYVMLEEARFEEKLKVTIKADPLDCTCRVPNLILQPIVENAIRHGAMKREKGTVTIAVKRGDRETMIDVADNGPGMDKAMVDRLYAESGTECPQQTNGHGIGMLNVQHRLIGIFGKDAGLQVITGETGTIVRMIIPNRKENADEDSSSR